jgi:membrane-associated phospholipid phosphatase
VNFWQSLTDLGDAAFLASFAIGITLWLGARPGRRSVTLWVSTFAAAMGIVVATKLAFIGWGVGIRMLDFTGISGHATLAATIFPILGHLACARTPRWIRALGVALAAWLAVAVGISRVILGAHSPAEVVVGLGVGFAVASIVIRCTPTLGSRDLRWLAPLILLGMLGSGSVFYGERAHAQRWLVVIALEVSGHERPFTRASWHAQTAAQSMRWSSTLLKR